MNLTESFLFELFKLAFKHKEIVEILTAHLKYHYLPSDSLKKVFKVISLYYKEKREIPTPGIVMEFYGNDIELMQTLAYIKEAETASVEMILKPLDKYIKYVKFQELHAKTAELYNENRQEEAMELLAKDSVEIVNFSIRSESTYFEGVFADFADRHEQRLLEQESGANGKKIPFGIDYLDNVTFGGMDEGETALIIMRSGAGKSTWLKHQGILASRLGYKVLHIQAEGSKREAMDKYDQAWTALLYNDLRSANISEELYKQLLSIAQKIVNKNSDIYVHAYEQFGEASMLDVRNLIVDFEKIHGKPWMVIIDYIKHFHPGDGKKYGISVQDVKMKKENTAEAMKNIATEFKTRLVTADQASDIPRAVWNDPDQVLTRHNIANAKNLPDSFSFVFTGNQTDDEKKNSVMRIYIDKLRYYKEANTTFKIATNYDHGRFYDKKRTVKEFTTKNK